MQAIAQIGLMVSWILWLWPFASHNLRAPRRQPAVTATSSRWGIALQLIAYVFASAGVPGPRPLALLAAALVLAALAVWCAWASVRHLGKQLRVHAGLYSDHELIRTGPYRIVRHPIYAAMLAMYLATAGIRSTWPLALAGLVLFIAGTEIRVRIEDGLLGSRFGEQFAAYRAAVPAYVPFIR